MALLKTPEDLAQALQMLIKKEPRFASLLKAYGQPGLRHVPASLESLLVIVTEQFLSLSAGAAIWGRVRPHLGAVTAAAVLDCSPEMLVGLGLSRAKAKTFHAAAAAWASGAIAIDSDCETVGQQLLRVWGIGPWTVEIFLLTAHGHGDAWPSGDVALRHAAQDFLGLAARPTSREMERIGAAWKPHRAAASRLLWAHYRALKAPPKPLHRNDKGG